MISKRTQAGMCRCWHENRSKILWFVPRPAFIALDLLDRGERTANSISQHLLGQVERLTLPAYPIAKRTRGFHLFSQK